eukprot:TRINITY_DN36447_c0_g1_i1.p1 TRINITY_DN36447_c0_g1~~TRINITY_DN36447_c0_g1_i1.p1  ORF type:complete len:1458 (+),score=332.80 TRINITY_DN36447_c0_g1_i1:40-4374(+)
MGRRRLPVVQPWRGEGPPPHEREEANGPFIDFIVRKLLAQGYVDEEGQRLLSKDDLEALGHHLALDYGAYTVAKQAMTRERLAWKINQAIAYHMKETSGRNLPKGFLLQKMKEVCGFYSHYTRLRHQVLQSMFEGTVQMAMQVRESRAELETTQARRRRLREYWPEFHRSGLLDAPVAAQRPSTSGGLSASPPESRSNSRPSSQGSSRSPLTKNNVYRQDLQWRSRGSRSKCSSGRWDWTGGADWQDPRVASKLSMPHANPAMQRSNSLSSLGAMSQQQDPDTVCDDTLASTRGGKSIAKEGMNLGSYIRSRGGIFPKLAFADGKPSASKAMSSSKPALPNVSKSQLLQSDDSQQLLLTKSKCNDPFAGKCRGKAPTKQYLQACRSQHLLPSTSAFVTGHSDCMNASCNALNDKGLGALCEMLKTGDLDLQEVNLAGNSKISSKAFSQLFRFLSGNTQGKKELQNLQTQSAQNLSRLSLRECPAVGQDNSLSELLSLLTSRSATNLQHLDLGRVPIGIKWHKPMTDALRSHPCLTKLCLANTGLGVRSAGEEDYTTHCIVDLLSSDSIKELDLSWNCFSSFGFDQLGRKLVESGVLQTLHLSHCSTMAHKGIWISPIVHLFEHLSESPSLRLLDVSGNHLDFRGAIILEDALEYNSALSQLDTSNNGLGILGLRSLLRLLARETSGLETLQIENCSKGAVMDRRTDFQVFRASRPHGRYTLDLTRPYHRTLLRMLYKAAESLKLPCDQAFREINADFSYSHASKNAQGIFAVPREGKLSITFAMEKALEEKTLADHGGRPEFSAVLNCHFQLLRIRPAESKLIAMLKNWKKVESLRDDQAAMIDALSKDFSLSFAQIANMCQASRTQTWDIVASLQSTMMQGVQIERHLCGLRIPSIGDYVRMLRRAANLFSFNPDNPTGGYRLELSNPVDYNVAEKLVILDNWESTMRLQDGQIDISQMGNNSHARNVEHGGQPLPCDLVKWIPLEFDVLQLDYSSTKRPPADAQPVDEASFEKIVAAIQEFSRAPAVDRLQALRLVSNLFFVSCLQLRQLLGLFQDAGFRQEIFIMFFNRVSDIQNEKIVRSRFDTDEELMDILKRLGFGGPFPFMQPEQAHFHMKLKNYDERLAVSLLLKLANKEKISNLKNPKFTHADGSEDALPLGVPRSWETLSNIPKEGVFEVDYVCSPEDRNFLARRALVEDIGDWDMSQVQEADVCWWSSISKASTDVMDFVFWIISTYGDCMKAFYDIDGGGGQIGDDDVEITMREFEEGCKRIGFNKFEQKAARKKSDGKVPASPASPAAGAGLTEQQRLIHVFRYLDPSGEGKVSAAEWAVFQQVEMEIKLSIKEFVMFCERNFGPHLSDAWAVLDSDGGGEVSFDEWQETCAEAQYFGPTMPIFKYIDKDDGGSFDGDEFQVLEKFQGKTLNEVLFGNAYARSSSKHASSK